MSNETILTQTLLIGNVSCFRRDDLDLLFEGAHVILMGPDLSDHHEGNYRWIHIHDTRDIDFRRRFEMYHFDQILFVSDSMTYQKALDNEITHLLDLLDLLRKHPSIRFLFLGSQNILFGRHDRNTFLLEAENHLLQDMQKMGYKLSIVESPCLFAPDVPGDYWHTCFSLLTEGVSEQPSWCFPEHPESPFAFLTVRDLVSFLHQYRLHILDDSENLQPETIHIGFPSPDIRYLDFCDALQNLLPNAKIRCDQDAPVLHMSPFTGTFITKSLDSTEVSDATSDAFHWAPAVSPLSILPNSLQPFLKNRQKILRKKKVNCLLSKTKNIRTGLLFLLELLLGALLVEYLNQKTGSSVQFRVIDLRLLYVVILSGVYGSTAGTIAAVLETISLCIAFQQQGRTFLQIFYDPGNWIPFILLFLVAAVLGYQKEKHTTAHKEAVHAHEKLQKDYDGLLELYRESEQYKQEYKRNLIESRDGFGRIFDVVERLGHMIPERIYAESIHALEEVLDTDSVAIYSISDENTAFARLEVSSQRLNMLPRSLNLSDYRYILNTLEQEEIYVNRTLNPDAPMYVTGIKVSGSYRLLIMLYHVEFSQMSSYYENLIRILRRLMENALLRAWAYQKARFDDTYLDGTMIVNSIYLERQFEIQEAMRNHHVSDYRILRLRRNGRSFTELNRMLQNHLRTTDTVGLGYDGNLYVLCSQVDSSSEKIVMNRFSKLGFEVALVTILPKQGAMQE